MRSMKIRLLWVVAAFGLGFTAQDYLSAQAGPKKESGDTVARPKKKATDDATTPPKEEPDQLKIPTKLGKKKGDEKGPIEGPTFRSDTLAVNVDVAVLDNRGRFIPNIPPGNFRILEDGVPQKVSGFNKGEAPMTVCLVIEFSNLFQGYWTWGWQETLTASYGFLETLKAEDYVAVVAFDLRTEILSDFSTDKRAAYEAMQRLRIPAYSESDMFDALTDTADRMSEIEGRKAILYIGSGWDTLSKQTYDKARRALQTAGVPVYSISILQTWRELMDARGGLGAIARLDFLQADNMLRTFAKETGGQAYFPRFLGEYPGIFRAVADSLRNQYSIAYNPTNTVRDGKYRKIKVELVNPATGEALRIVDEKGKPIKYQVIAKAGYNAPREVE
jgi:Ca-activated chloride channel homolog